jgi:hypothetical protein
MNAYQLNGVNPSKKNNKIMKPEKGTCKEIKEYQNARRGLEYTHRQGKGISRTKHSLYKGTHGDELTCVLACE